MPGISGALNIAKWALYADQLAMEITSNNIANANTPGYSKQSLRLQANYPITMGPGQIGTGVMAKEVLRAYDYFLNEQVCEKKSDYSKYSAQKDALEEIEMIFNESDETGINKLTGEFWNAWSDVANNPDSLPERDALLAKTTNLVQAIQAIDYDLRSYQRHLDSNIQVSVEKINTMIDEIADLNQQISTVEVKGMINANDLRDKRDMLLEQLSEYMGISYYEEQQSGQVMVYILGGTPLVLGNETYHLSSEKQDTDGTPTDYTQVFWNDHSGRQVNITNRLEKGKIAGWVDVRDNRIESYINSMNTFTEELIWQVNSLHSAGTGLASLISLTSTADVSATDVLDADFRFSDRFNPGGSFDIVIYDQDGNVVSDNPITLAAGATVGDLINDINSVSHMNAAITSGNKFSITSESGYTFAINPTDGADNNNALAILGINTFFDWDESAGDFTQTIGINPSIESNPQAISAGHLDENKKIAPGDNQVALDIYGLQDAVIDIDGSNTTLDSYYSSFVSDVGVHVQNAQMNEKYNDTLLSQYIKRKESITGVNLDEEMAQILKFQHAYQAAAKLISISDEMLQTLLSIKQ